MKFVKLSFVPNVMLERGGIEQRRIALPQQTRERTPRRLLCSRKSTDEVGEANEGKHELAS